MQRNLEREIDEIKARLDKIQQEQNTQTPPPDEELFRLTENRTAERILGCIGNGDRLGLLLALLREPMSVASLVEKRGYSSTGQVYHHLKPLIAAELVAEDKKAAKGTYFVRPDKVGGVMTLLAGIHALAGGSTTAWDATAEIHGGATMVDERYLATAEETEKIIATFFSSVEPLVLKAFPPKEKKKLVILQMISSKFEKGKRYGEKEVNQILEEIYPDYVTIRRYLIEYGFLDRTRDCAEYWVTE